MFISFYSFQRASINISLNPQQFWEVRKVDQIWSFQRCGNWSSENLSNLLRVIKKYQSIVCSFVCFLRDRLLLFAQAELTLLSSSNPSTSISLVAGTAGGYYV